MLKLGFKEDIDKILMKIRNEISDIKNLQICLFSATIPHWVKSLARQYMKKDLRIVDLC
jgi:superfamily II DNA/RNA helicase